MKFVTQNMQAHSCYRKAQAWMVVHSYVVGAHESPVQIPDQRCLSPRLREPAFDLKNSLEAQYRNQTAQCRKIVTTQYYFFWR